MAETRGDRTRAALLDAAIRRFTEHGWAGTTTADVSQDAGLSEGTVFAHYGNKAGLLIAAMEAYYDELAADVEAVAGVPGPVEDRLRRLVAHWVTRMDADWPLVSVFAQQARFGSEGEVAAAFRDMNRRITRIFGGVLEDLKSAGAIRADLPTRLLRDTLFGSVEHVMIARAHTGRPDDLGPTVDGLLDLFLHGAAAPTPKGPPTSSSLEAVDRKLDEVLARLGTSPRRAR